MELVNDNSFKEGFYLALNATRKSPCLFDKMSVLSRMRLLYDTLTHQSKLEHQPIILPSSTIFYLVPQPIHFGLIASYT